MEIKNINLKKKKPSSHMQFNKVLNEPEDNNSLICGTVTVSTENGLFL